VTLRRASLAAAASLAVALSSVPAAGAAPQPAAASPAAVRAVTSATKRPSPVRIRRHKRAVSLFAARATR